MHRSRNTPRELDFIHFWKPFVRIFQFLSISHYGIFRPELKDHRIKSTLFRIYFILNISIQLTSAYTFFLLEIKVRMRIADRYNVSPLFMYIFVGTRVTQLLSFIVIPCEAFFNRHTEQKLFETLQCIDDIFQKKLNYPIDYGIHRRRQIRTISLLFTGLTIFLSMNIYVTTSDQNLREFLGNLPHLYMMVVWRMRVVQNTFFINALCNLLYELKTMMQRQQHRVKYNSAHWKGIQYARKIYSNIWLFKTLIRDCFGYSMVLFGIDSTMKLINGGYWIYMNLGSIESVIHSMR